MLDQGNDLLPLKNERVSSLKYNIRVENAGTNVI
jgi:hypothetical protein